MKFQNALMVATALLAIILLSIPATASDAKYAKETEAYKESLAAWAQGVNLARQQALQTYSGVQFIVDEVKWEDSKNYGNVKDLIISMRVFNTSSVYVELPSAFMKFCDSDKREVNLGRIKTHIELAPGDIREITYGFSGTSFNEYRESAMSGKCAVQIYPMSVEVRDLPDYKGKLTANGAPFLPNKPRDPFWLDEKEINFMVGSAEMEAGVYDQNVKFPPYGWWPVPGVNGNYSGTLPGPMATAKAPQPMPAYLKNSNQEQRGEEDDMTMQETTEAVKATGEAAKAGISLIKTLGSLF